MSIFPPRAGASTPWGWADSVRELAPGIIQVSTPSHGGIWLAPDRLAQVAPEWRAYAAKWSHGWGEAWFEEDCCALAVVATWPWLFARLGQSWEHVQADAIERLERWMKPAA